MLIREATLKDLPAILSIYNEVILTSTAVYCDQPVTLEERVRWYEGRREKDYPVLVAELDGQIAGYASFGDFRSFPGYRFSIEHSVHLAPAFRGRGIGSALVEALFAPAKKLGKHAMIAAVDADNAGSIRFHEKLGFTQVARMPEVGYKFDRWLDLVMLEKIVG
jgi:L-amino acid N-acyltransferase